MDVRAQVVLSDSKLVGRQNTKDTTENQNGLKAYEALMQGRTDEARTFLAMANLSDPYAMYVRARLTSDAMVAADMYKEIVAEAPNSPMAIAALRQLYQFHYAIGQYIAARTDSLELQHLTDANEKAGSIRPGDLQQVQGITGARQDLNFQGPDIAHQNAVRYTVQFGAFSSTTNAHRFVRNLMRKGIHGEVLKRIIRNRVLYLVVSGDFITEDTAQRFADTLKGKSINCIVVER